jgi:FlaA1/EpsC-like NDP-sugar epimerase
MTINKEKRETIKAEKNNTIIIYILSLLKILMCNYILASLKVQIVYNISMNIDKRILNFLVIIVLSTLTFSWTYWIFHEMIQSHIIVIVIIARIIASLLLFKDFSLAWSKASQKTFLIKSVVYISAFILYMPLLYSQMPIYFFLSELFIYLFSINLLMYSYYYIQTRKIVKHKHVILYGAGSAGVKLKQEFDSSIYRVDYFVDDDIELQKRSIDSIAILSQEQLLEKIHSQGLNPDLLVIAMPSSSKETLKNLYDTLSIHIKNIKTLPSLEYILHDRAFSKQLKEFSISDLLARHPQDLDKAKIASFVQDKCILITGAGGSIGSEIVRQCIAFHAKKLILLDHSEYNLYQIEQEVSEEIALVSLMQSVVDKASLDKTFGKYRPEIVIHAAAYKHVPLVEENIHSAIINNVIGTKNCIDIAIKYKVAKFVLISTDKAVRPSNVMGTTKRICELYAQNVQSHHTSIVAVRFGNVLGSSGSVIPKFQEQIKQGQDITVTHPDITRYFMLIPEACELVLQAGAIGKGGEIFILDMGAPIKIVDLAKKMIELSGKHEINIVFTGLRRGEKLYEELLIDESDMHTQYDSITVASPTPYPIDILLEDIQRLVNEEDSLKNLKKIVPEFEHKKNT